MQTLFSPDSKFMLAMGRICDLLLLNLFFLVSCVPVVTIGAAVTALYTVCFRFGTQRERGVLKSYFAAFRDNFRQSTAAWLTLLLCIGTAGLNTLLFYQMSGPLHYVFPLFALLFVLALLMAAYVFPLLSQFTNDTRATFRNALVLSVGYLPRSLLITVINVFPFALLLLDLYLFLQTGFLWVALYFSSAAYINSLLLKKVFAPYLPAEEN